MTTLRDLVDDFIGRKITAQYFADMYFYLYKKLSEHPELAGYFPVGDVIGSLFLAVDSYCAPEFMAVYEKGRDLNDKQLWQTVKIFMNASSIEQAYQEMERVGLIA